MPILASMAVAVLGLNLPFHLLHVCGRRLGPDPEEEPLGLVDG